MDYLQYFKVGALFMQAGTGKVLNLIINGLPSIHIRRKHYEKYRRSFKPYYKWITFNTLNHTVEEYIHAMLF